MVVQDFVNCLYMQIKVGTIVGNWKVTSEKYKKDNLWWNDCECICGKTKAIKTWWLNNNKSKGCGCTNTKGRFKSQAIGDLSASYYNSFKSSRRKKGINFSDEVSMGYLWELFLQQEGKCAVSGVDIILNRRYSEQHKGRVTDVIQTASLDRIDNSLGYTTDNVQWVHKDINYMRGGMSVRSFVSFCREVVKYNENLYINEPDFSGKRKYFGGSTGLK